MLYDPQVANRAIEPLDDGYGTGSTQEMPPLYYRDMSGKNLRDHASQSLQHLTRIVVKRGNHLPAAEGSYKKLFSCLILVNRIKHVLHRFFR